MSSSTTAKESYVDILIVGAAVLLAAAVIMTRRSTRRTYEAEVARRETEERLRLIALIVVARFAYARAPTLNRAWRAPNDQQP